MPGIYLYALYSGVQFGTFNYLSGLFGARKTASSSGIVGGMAATAGTIVSYPFDLIRTREAIGKRGSGLFLGSFRHARSIVLEEGLIGLYRGIIPSLAQVVPYMAITFGVFSKSNQILRLYIDSPSWVDFFGGAISGATSKTILMPIDVIRKRLQVSCSIF